MARYDYLIVGCGFAGSVLAERLANEHDARILMIDKRDHVGGNAYDEKDEAGILIHRYGPHIFHTNSDEVFGYLSRFTDWRPYEHRVLANVRDQLVPIPINRTTLNELFDLDLKTDEEAAEYLASRANVGAGQFAMMLAGPRLRVTVATTHVPLREVAGLLTADGIASTICLTADALARRFGIATPRVAVAGLNPHAGEAGRFGDEEDRLVRPAIEAARARLAAGGTRAEISGPHVPDVVFREAAGGRFDAVVALYHDQGLIPLKLLHFDEGVNVTLGLPFVRTSPDHGTAYDIAGSGRASADSFLAALDLAGRLVR